MTPPIRSRAGLPRMRGQSMLDYLFTCAALAFFLFVPIQDDPARPGKSRSTIQVMIDAFHTAYQNMSHAISLPN